MLDFVNVQDPLFQKAALVIILTPIIWNILARLEYYTHFLTKLAGGNKYIGCYILAAYIFTFSAYRDYVFNKAIEAQSEWKLLVSFAPITQYVGYALIAVGGVFVLSSMWVLGITGTYLGDYFGILMDAPVTSFPFNVLSDPMYDGASMAFLGQALLKNSGAGVALSIVVFVTYRLALLLESPFTAYIYEQREKARAASRGGKASSPSNNADSTDVNHSSQNSKKRKSKKLD